jgi:hypothetical protein
MRKAGSIATLLLFLLPTVFVGGSATAQVPPHQPGTICFTPKFWCWMQRPMIKGQTCYCMTQSGPVRGVAG